MTAPAPNPNPEHTADKRALIVLAWLCIIVIGGVVAGTYFSDEKDKVPPEAFGLLGSIVTGILLFMRDIVSAIRASWAEFTNAKTTDLLAGAAPPPIEPAPKDAAEAARQTADAADNKAAQIERTSLD